MDNGFFTIHRKIFDNPLWKKPLLAHLAVHLIGKANHDTKRFIFNGQEEELKRGQMITGRKTLALETGINESTIYKLLKNLENIGFCNIKSNNKFSVITLTKYSQYQDKAKDKNASSNNQVTTKEQQSNTNNNYNNVNNILSPKVDGISPPKAKGFQSIDQLLNAPQKHLRLIGQYFQLTRKKFSSPEALTIAVKRWMKDASAIVKFTDDEINQALQEAQEHKGIWTLGTVLKKLTK